MKNAVDLKKLIDEMDMQFESIKTYVNKNTGEIVSVSSDKLRDIEDGEIVPPYTGFPDWEKEELELCEEIIDSDLYIEIPSKYEIDEYSIMEDFCLLQEDAKISDELYRSIKGKGAFSRFKDRIRRYNIEDEWYKYKEERLKELAIRWCEENEIDYVD